MNYNIQFKISITKSVFWIVFALLFCIGGFMAFIGIPFRPFMVSGFALILFLFRNIKLNRILFLYSLFFFEIVISGFFNNSSLIQIVLFLRNLMISYPIYFLASSYLNSDQSAKRKQMIKWCSLLGLLQLPIVVFQKVFYDNLMKVSQVEISYLDIGSGSFFVKNDSAMSIFLLGLIIYYLFNHTDDKFRNIKVFVYVLAIFFAGSKIMQLGTLLIITYHFFGNLSLRSFVIAVILFLLF